MSNIRIAASILNADFTRLGEQVCEAEAAGAHLIHIDIMDGHFVPNISVGPLVVEAVSRVTSLPLDVHLMINQPERYIKDFARAGATRISVHVENTPHLHRTLQAISEFGVGAGVALNPHTSSVALSQIMHMLDVIIVMTVNPGFGGQQLIKETMPKLAEIRAMIGESGRQIDLEVDGGVNAETVATVTQAGANVLIVGTALFHHEGGIKMGYDELLKALQK